MGYLQAMPQAGDRETVQQMIDQAKAAVARWN
jgi:hypothetical protein